jgi:NAD(P)-dependent dehydrogenase (short-subunit alcohol dehydrogenase family)
VNHLAPALLARALDQNLSGSRIVIVGSSQHGAAGPFDPAIFGLDSSASWARRYEATKLLNLLFTSERPHHPHAASMEAIDPGFVHTNLGRNARGAFRIMLTLTRRFQTTPKLPAQLIADRLAAAGFMDGGYQGLNGPAKRAPNARDEASARSAWEWTNDLLTQH